MNNSSKHKIDLAKALRTSGYLLPLDESEVESFERNLRCDDDSKPADWDNPLRIIERGKINKVDLKSPHVDEHTINNLSMAARDGKAISDAVRKRMNEDRKSSE
ncbi:MAG: hypothetical protein LPK49_09895 [Bacteroidota bacterium]|nr:hypothetical protein [Bacteroidota bacterium]MDX5431341.1 hypothetical protein [Bacteroidota bacterium]